MSLESSLSWTTSGLFEVINKAIDEILKTASMPDSALRDVVHLFAWLIILVALSLIFRRLLRFFFRQFILGIMHDFLQLGKTWERKKEFFPNFVFDPFNNMMLSRTRVSNSIATRVWGLLGTDREILAGLRQKHKAARVVLAISIIVTTAMAAYGSASFVAELCRSSDARIITTVSAVLFGSAIYTSVIYAFDLSIVTSIRSSLLQVMGRVIFAIFMAIVVGAQLNIDFHKEYLTARLKKTIGLERLAENLQDLKGKHGSADEEMKTARESISRINEQIESIRQIPRVSTNDLYGILGTLKSDKDMLECMYNREVQYGDFSACNPQSNFGLYLNTGPRKPGPRKHDCLMTHVSTNVCKLHVKLRSVEEAINDINKQIGAAADTTKQQEAFKSMMGEINKFQKVLVDNAGKSSALQRQIADAEAAYSEAQTRATGSKTDLLREMITSIKEDIKGEGDGTSYWMLAMFLTVVFIDLFAVIAKLTSDSSLCVRPGRRRVV